MTAMGLPGAVSPFWGIASPCRRQRRQAEPQAAPIGLRRRGARKNAVRIMKKAKDRFGRARRAGAAYPARIRISKAGNAGRGPEMK